MVTFLTRFGFQLRYVLATDLISLDALFLSAMRCTYLDKAEDAVTTGLILADAFGSQKGPGLLAGRLTEWRKIIDARQKAKGKTPDGAGRNDAAQFIADFAGGFRGMAGGG